MEPHFKQIFRYLISGLAGLTTNVLAFSFFYQWLNLHYVSASIIGFCVGVIVSFVCQKFFTFENLAEGKAIKQFASHIVLLSFNLILTTVIIIFLVEMVNLPKIVSIILANGVAAIWSFFVYKKLIFHE